MPGKGGKASQRERWERKRERQGRILPEAAEVSTGQSMETQLTRTQLEKLLFQVKARVLVRACERVYQYERHDEDDSDDEGRDDDYYYPLALLPHWSPGLLPSEDKERTRSRARVTAKALDVPMRGLGGRLALPA